MVQMTTEQPASSHRGVNKQSTHFFSFLFLELQQERSDFAQAITVGLSNILLMSMYFPTPSLKFYFVVLQTHK